MEFTTTTYQAGNTFSDAKLQKHTKLQSENTHLKQVTLKLHDENELLKSQISALKNSNVSSKHQRGEDIENLVDVTQQLDDEISVLQNTLHKKQKHQQSKQDEKTSLQAKFLQNSKKIATLEQTLLDLDSTHEQNLSNFASQCIKTEAQTQQIFEDLSLELMELQNEMNSLDNERENIQKFWEKISAVKKEVQNKEFLNKCLSKEQEKYEMMSREQEKMMIELQDYQNVPTQEFVETVQQTVFVLNKQIEQEQLNFIEEMHQKRSYELDLTSQARNEENQLTREIHVLQNQIDALQNHHTEMQQQQNAYHTDLHTQFCDVGNKCGDIVAQANEAVIRYRELLQAEKMQRDIRQIDWQFVRQLESEAHHSIMLLQRDVAQLHGQAFNQNLQRHGYQQNQVGALNSIRQFFSM